MGPLVLPRSFLGRGGETEVHIKEALRLSPRDTLAPRWLVWVGLAKAQLGADAEAAIWIRRGLEANPNYSVTHFDLAAVLVRAGKYQEARASVTAGLALDPRFTIRRYRDVTFANSDDPTYRAGRERLIEGMRTAGCTRGLTLLGLDATGTRPTLVALAPCYPRQVHWGTQGPHRPVPVLRDDAFDLDAFKPSRI